MKVAIGQFQSLDEETAEYARQLGVESIQVQTPDIEDSGGYWEYESLRRIVEHCASFNLHLEAVENVPLSFMDDIIRGGPQREEQLNNYCKTIRNVGKAGIAFLGHHFMPTSVWRTSMGAPARGGATATAFDMELIDQGNANISVKDVAPCEITEKELWNNYTVFLDHVLPVAEAAGVRLALHPDDPPVPAIGKTARIFYSVDSLRRAQEIASGSPAWGLDLCLGTVSEMVEGADAVRDAVSTFGPAGNICYVHFRQILGTNRQFVECFLGEGTYSPADTIRLLHEVGFDGFLLDDHVPRMTHDSPWGHRSHAYAIGYIQALIAACTNGK